VYGGKRRISKAFGILRHASGEWDESLYLKSEGEKSPRRGDGKVVEKPPLGLSNL
jgi:hypothetical protein